MKRRGEPVHGWVVLDKPLGMTSTQAVGKVRWLFKAQKAGHGGTLDPLATGLLPLALGEATKTVNWAMEGSKTYRVTVKWGEERSTDDLEGEITTKSERRPTKNDIESILKDFTGEIMQAPPAFSAIKVAGERAYDLARAWEAVDLAPRPVRIDSIQMVDCGDPNPSRQGGEALQQDQSVFEVTCGKGTYIRSLARDMGRALGCFGHVTQLRRIRVGAFTESQMIPLEKLEDICNKAPGDNAKKGVLLPIETVLDGIPALAVDERQAQRLRQGQEVLLRGASAPIAEDAVLVTFGSKPVGICSIEQGTLKPRRLFNL